MTSNRSQRPRCLLLVLLLMTSVHGQPAMADSAFATCRQWIRHICIDCHGNHDAEAGLNLEQLVESPDLVKRFRTWRKIAEMVEQKRMPPADAEPLDDRQRQQLVSAVRNEIQRVARDHSRDPGEVTLRRLTSAEYAYTIRDLTGLDLDVERDFVSDAVGGEGFTNVGGAQFVQDSTLERYLTAAKRVADHAVIGAGPLRFHGDPGKTGLELSAITRIQNIYRAHGFRTAAGEGGEAFGLDRYARAFFVAWQFQYRDQLELAGETLATLAARENVDVRFAHYIRSVLTGEPRSFPTSDIIAKWRALPQPAERRATLQHGPADSLSPESPSSKKLPFDIARQVEEEVREQCNVLQAALLQWQSHLGENPDAKEEARVLLENSFDVSQSQRFEMNINWPPGTRVAHLTFSIVSADHNPSPDCIVIWKNASIQFRIPDRVLKDSQPLRTVLNPTEPQRLKFGTHPRGGSIGPDDFVTVGASEQTIQIPIHEEATSAQLIVEAELDMARGDDRIVRCTITQHEETDQGKSVSALIANPSGEAFDTWKQGVLEFARVLPQISHREPAPSDRDPIPPPFDSTYNNSERNFFHARVKYHRDDDFLVRNILDDATRVQLDQAWMDLLGSFEYHDIYLGVVARKFQLDLAEPRMEMLDRDWIAQLPAEPRTHVGHLHQERQAIEAAFLAAEPQHLDDVMDFADRAWRRPVTMQQRQRLVEFYRGLRDQFDLNHPRAIRALLARVLLAPDFLYRAEKPPNTSITISEPVPGRKALSDWELASRLSYFLWSSTPDEALRRAAQAGKLSNPDELARQANRMLRNPKARRLATEFFGQWLGFYRFDQYRGIDPQRFPDFGDDLKRFMYDEAVTFFEHIIRRNRSIDEILFADYSFMSPQLAEHYAISMDSAGTTGSGRDASLPIQVASLDQFQRGGLLGLGAVLTVTSAPRRTSPVKRGDWILRRVLGTPVPPPPADAGSIPADDVLADGKTVRERLEAHRRDETCRNCHARIDPLGFSLEHFDAIGRWRDTYRDGQPIDASGTLRDGTTIRGAAELRAHLIRHQDKFRRTLCTKLAGYALGRSESIADVLLIEQMLSGRDEDRRFSDLVEKIVRSDQFRYKRVSAMADRTAN